MKNFVFGHFSRSVKFAEKRYYSPNPNTISYL